MSPDRALALDFALLPGDRQNASGVDSLSIADNMLLPDVTRFFRGGFLRPAAMMREAYALGERYEVRPNDSTRKTLDVIRRQRPKGFDRQMDES